LRRLPGRSIIRTSKGVATVALTIDVAGGHITGFSGLGSDRKNYDEHVELPPGTYWGPLISLVIKNFDHNAEDNRLVFNSVVATPKPRVIGMELLRGDKTTVDRRGGKIQVTQFELRPTINPVVDPIVPMMAPETHFFVQPGDPPSMARFEGPRNYAGQQIRIE